MPPFKADTEITGPVAAKLFVSSETADADIFLVLRLFTPDMREVTFSGTVDPHTPIGQGWLRASHRKLDKKLTKPWRPYHSHDQKQPLKPGQVVELIEYKAPAGRGRVDARPCDAGFAHLALDVDDVDAAVAAAALYGVKAINAPLAIDQGPNKGKKVVYVRDWDGVTLEFIGK